MAAAGPSLRPGRAGAGRHADSPEPGPPASGAATVSRLCDTLFHRIPAFGPMARPDNTVSLELTGSFEGH